MSDTIQFNSRVGDNGVLSVQVNLGQAEAKKDVVVTIAPVVSAAAQDATALNWHDFVEQTYGSCAGQELERQAQGQFDQREPIA